MVRGEAKPPSPRRWINALSIFACACAAAHGQSFRAAAGECPSANLPLFHARSGTSDWLLPQGFADSLWAQLKAPAQELGYCLVPAPRTPALPDTAGCGDCLYLQASAEDDGAGSVSISIAALRVRDLAAGKLREAETRPLVYLRFYPNEAAGVASVLAKKVAENLRSQYVATLLIRSSPPGAEVRSASGLEGTTPVEWVVPLGTFPVALRKPGFLKTSRDLELAAPGQHTYDLQLTKRRFYHSRFIYPTLAAGLVSAAAFVMENHYYGVYQSLGPEDRANRPQVFGENFRTAKNYERIGYTALGIAACGLILSFVF